MIGVGSVGVDMVDVAAATAAGLVVTNVPDVFIEEVADHAMMLLLDVRCRTATMSRMAREGQWYQARPILWQVPRLLGQTLGLYAFGNVARCTARRAQAFGLRVIAYDPYVSELEITALGVEPVGFNELLERSDYLSIHAPHNEETEHAIDAAALARMKPTAVVINTARGPAHRRAGADRGAAERGDRRRRPRRAGAGAAVRQQSAAHDGERAGDAPHRLGHTRMRPETRRRVGREVALVLRGKWPMSCVNPTVLPKTPLERWQPYPMGRGPNR